MTYKMPAGKFKAQCLTLMDRVKKYGQTVTITKHGRPVAKMVPVTDEDVEVKSAFGVMQGTGEVVGDIVKPTGEKWNVED